MSLRYYIFLKDVLLLALTSFGGPQAHIALMFKLLVEKRRYLTDQELIELNALCQILPGPTSTQTITAIGFRIGGPNLAYLTLLVWIMPAATIMALAAFVISYLQENNISLHFLRIILPMAVGFVAYAAWKISAKVVNTKVAIMLMVVSAVLSYFFRSPWVYPLLLIAGGAVTALRFKQHPQEKDKRLHIQWANFILYVGVFILAAALGGATSSLPVRLFENFYRNGSMVFGGGQVLVPLMYTEFVQFKGYLTGEEFLSGYAIAQALPGPTFSFTAFVGNLAMREYGIAGQFLGSFVATVGIFLPGTFLIFFVIRFWEELKKYRVVRASLEGISAVSSGMVVAAAIMLYHPIDNTLLNFGIVVATFALLMFTKIPAPVLILTGLLLGFVL
ncbi:chromate efflux transporter [Pontibacter sp. BT310]|jgi:chromate transporter|uniref:Chromate efflux transporter n=1 Tax=Pontibacter populi TaxID=890055 RepID=A0ABS6X8N8_9BACT|nr:MULTISPECIES: chromate efflux transporter [Pontibacter]MBJ6117501.1 chromate efflux transporter [Pontibacter sp. BT310]MBR0569926.1 chromate efflux transporter [Microvirga sp. STS03]MBW3364354.1 chromate efflux transporter [Pontibacter populi]